jgi:hypothetical protein
VDETRTVTLGEALTRAAAAGEPVQQKEATAIFLEALRLADQVQATLSSAGTLLNEDGSMELAPALHKAGAEDPFASVSGAYQLADELFRGAAPLALGRGDGTRAAPFATVRDMLCSLEFHLLVESGRGGPPPPTRSDSRRAIIRLLAAAPAAGNPSERPVSAPEARRDLIRTFDEVAAAKKEKEIEDPFALRDGRSGSHRAPARSPVEWSAAAPASASPPASASSRAPAPPPTAPVPQPAVAAPAPAGLTPPPAVPTPPPVAMTPPPVAMTPPPPVTWPPAATAPQPAVQPAVRPRWTVRRFVPVLVLLFGSSVVAAIAVAVRRSSPAAEAVPAVRAAAAASDSPAAPAPIDPTSSPRAELPAPRPAKAAVRARPVAQAQVPSRGGEKRAPVPSKARGDPAAEARARAKVQLGEELFTGGRLFQALVAFREADQEQPLPESARRQGDIYRLQHDDALAAAAYQRCLRLSPSPADAREVRRILDELRREAPAAQ